MDKKIKLLAVVLIGGWLLWQLAKFAMTLAILLLVVLPAGYLGYKWVKSKFMIKG